MVGHIARGINPHINTSEHVRPVFNYYNKFSSTKYVYGNKTEKLFPTKKSHVNYVVMDSEWEGIAAKTVEELPQVISYVKNQFLGFAIPYVKEGKDKLYFPDFIVQLKTKNSPLITKNLIKLAGFSRNHFTQIITNTDMKLLKQIITHCKYDKRKDRLKANQFQRKLAA